MEKHRREEPKARKEREPPLPAIVSRKSGFSDFDIQTCSKTLRFLPCTRDRAFAWLGFKADDFGRLFEELKPSLDYLINDYRNYKKHTEGNLPISHLKRGANEIDRVIRVLMPDVIDPTDAQNRTFLQQIETAIVEMTMEEAVRRTRLEDHFHPDTFDKQTVIEACLNQGSQLQPLDRRCRSAAQSCPGS